VFMSPNDKIAYDRLLLSTKENCSDKFINQVYDRSVLGLCSRDSQYIGYDLKLRRCTYHTSVRACPALLYVDNNDQ
jgi:hypothetical protein